MVLVTISHRMLRSERLFQAVAFPYELVTRHPVWERDCARMASELPPGCRRVLDLGCGPGNSATHLRDAVPAVLAVDYAPAMLRRARKRDPRLLLVRGDARGLPLRDGSVDAVLCWDIFDFLAPRAAEVLAGKLTRMLRPEGLLLGFFGARAADDPRYTKYFIEDTAHLRHRFYPSACTRRWVLQNRDINHLFAGLELFDSVLLKSGVREILFRKRVPS